MMSLELATLMAINVEHLSTPTRLMKSRVRMGIGNGRLMSCKLNLRMHWEIAKWQKAFCSPYAKVAKA